jgi:hypothetical protein
MRVRTNDGKEGTIVERKTNQVLVKFNNGTVKGYRPEQVQEIGKPANNLRPPSRERDLFLLKLETIEELKENASTYSNDYAKGMADAYALVLELFNELK